MSIIAHDGPSAQFSSCPRDVQLMTMTHPDPAKSNIVSGVALLGQAGGLSAICQLSAIAGTQGALAPCCHEAFDEVPIHTSQVRCQQSKPLQPSAFQTLQPLSLSEDRSSLKSGCWLQHNMHMHKASLALRCRQPSNSSAAGAATVCSRGAVHSFPCFHKP